MKNIIEIENKINALAKYNEEISIDELNERKKEISKIIKYLVHTKNYYSKQKTIGVPEQEILSLVKDLIKKAKKVNKDIIDFVDLKYQQNVKKEDKPANFKRNNDLLELINIKNIVCSDNSKEEKEYALEDILATYENRLTTLLDDLSFFKELRKDLITLKSYEEINSCDNSIFNIKLEINECNLIIQSCKTFLAQIHGNFVKIDYPKNSKEKIKEDKINEYYYQIIADLLDDDKNYFFLKEIILNNPKFLKARKFNSKTGKYESIVFKVLDEYIRNTKLDLVNQKLIHINPIYFKSLLEIFLQGDLDLTKEEQEELSNRFQDFTEFLNSKGYSNIKEVNTSVEDFNEEKQETIYNTNLYSTYLNSLVELASKSQDRTNLTKEYLYPLQDEILDFMREYSKKYNEEATTKIISENLNISSYDIRNSLYLSDTFLFGDSKYAYSIGYDKSYNIYFRVNVLDTTFIEEDSIWYQEMQYNMINNSSKVNKDMKFRENHQYPVMTYQFKITKNGEVNSFKLYPSTIKIDKKVPYDEFDNYRDNPELKNIIACIKKILENYNIDYPYLSMFDIEDYLDDIINVLVMKYFEQNNLPSLYYTEIMLSDEEKIDIHNKICYYLSKIPKKEAHDIFKILLNLKVTRYYDTFKTPDSNIELDSRTFIGYLNMRIISLFKKGLWTSESMTKYLEILEECANSINKEDFVINYQKEKELKKLKVQKKGTTSND